MDTAAGKLLQYLDDHGLRENTFVFLPATTAPKPSIATRARNAATVHPGPIRGMKLPITEAGYRVPGIIRWPGHAQPRTTSAEPIGNLDSLPTACTLAGIAPSADQARSTAPISSLSSRAKPSSAPARCIGNTTSHQYPMVTRPPRRPLETSRHSRPQPLRTLPSRHRHRRKTKRRDATPGTRESHGRHDKDHPF